MDEQELQRLMQQAFQEIRDLGSVSKETADKIAAAGDTSAKFKKQLMDAGAQFTRTMTGLARSVGEGNTEFTVFNSVVDSVTGALTEMGKSIPFAGAAMVALGEGTKFLLGQLQATTKAFNQVGAAGLAGADGMTGLRDQFTTAGIDLQLYTKVITANSEALARFGGTADRGAARFAKALGQVNQDFGRQLMSLGNSFEDIAEQTAGYMALQTRLGRSQNMTQTQLAKGAFEYAKQLDALAKLTGQNKNELQKQQDAMLSETRFRARIQELENQGRGDAANRLRQLALVTQQLGPGMRDIIAGGGAITTEAGQEIFQATRGVASRIVQAVEGGMDPGEAARQLQAGTQAFVSANTSILKFTGDIPGFVSNFANVVDFSTREFRTLGEAAATTAAQIARPSELTAAAVSAQKEMMNLSVQINLLASNALPKAADAVTAFAEVLNTGLGAINKRLGTTLAVPQGGAAVVGEQPAARQGLTGPMPAWAQEQARQRGGGMSDGGIARGPESGYTATLHGTEAVVPLPDGKQIPVDLKGLSGDSLLDAIAKSLPSASPLAAPAMDPAKETFFAGMGTHGTIDMGNIYTDRKLTDMIMQKLGLNDLESKIAINKSGIGTNVSMFGDARGRGQGLEMGSAIAGGVMRDDIADAVAKLVEGGEPLQEALKKTAADFNAAMQEFIKQQAGPNNEGMMNLMMQLVDLQRSQNATSKQILQVSAN